MYRRMTYFRLVAATAAILIPQSVHALIVITPTPGQTFPSHPVQLVSQEVDVKLTDRAAEVSVECTYYNSTNMILEGTWIFPLPPEAAVDRFSMFVGGEEIEAELLDAAEARNIYESIVRQTRDPAILEYVDRQLLRARIYPIDPFKEATVKLYYTHPLHADFGVTDFVFPILDEEWSPIFWNDPQRRLQSRMTIEINTVSTLKAVTSPTHPAEVAHDSDHHATVRCAPEVLRQAGDFHLLCTYDTRDIAAQFLTTKNEDGQFFMGIIAPGNGEGMEILAKDVVFCFDRSGSMHGEKIVQAREALKFCLNSLNLEDRYAFVWFNDAVDVLSKGLVEAGTARSAALHKVDAIEADGGTFIAGALESALNLFEPGDRPRYLVFLTDGLPTVGITQPERILEIVRQHNDCDVRVFTFGVGYDLNAGLLNDLAEQNNGFSSYVAPEEDVEVAVSNFFRKMSRPVLADCRLELEGAIEVADVYPRVLPDVFAGNEIVVLGRFTGAGEATARLLGTRGSEPVNHTFNAEFDPDKDKYDFVAKLWAGRRIGYLLDEMRRSGESAEVKEEIVRLSKRYGIMTPYTSFLAAPEEVRVSRRDHFPVPQFGSQGTGAADAGARAAYANPSIEASKLQSPSTGSVVIGRSEMGDDLGSASEERHVAGRRFTLIDGVWKDWNVMSGKTPVTDTLVIKPYSEAYFRLAKNREIASILSLGDRLIFLWGNAIIKIDQNGEEKWNNKWPNL